MKIKVSDLKTKMQKILLKKKYSPDEIDFIIAMYLGGELRGHSSHGLASFPSFVQENFSDRPKPIVMKSTASVFMIDAQGNSGTLIGKRAADEAIMRAKKEILGAAIIKNMDGWLRPGGVAQYIADKGYIALVTNDGGGTSVAPPGGFDPTVGTNPIAYGFPTAKDSLVVDMATSKRAWGQVRLANKYGTDLPKDTFYNDRGEVTLDPQEAHSVKPFGDYKGFALAFFIEVLSGAMTGMDMIRETKNANNFGTKFLPRGGFILVIDPSQTYDLDKFKEETTRAMEKIKSTQSLKGEQIRIPGEEAGELQSKRIIEDVVDVADEVWDDIQKL